MATSTIYPRNVITKVFQTANTVWTAGAVTKASFTESVGIDGYLPIAAVLADDNAENVYKNLIVNITPFYVSVRSMVGADFSATVKVKFIFVPFDMVGVIAS